MKLNSDQKYNLEFDLAEAGHGDDYYRATPCCSSWVNVQFISADTYNRLNEIGKAKFKAVRK